jgi:hypothetical protein
MSLVLQSSSGGQITIQEPATASNFTQTLPAASGTTVLTDVAGTIALNATGANIVTASTNGSERMRIDSSGSLLVGTTETTGTLLTDGFQGVGISNAGWLVTTRFNNPSAFFKRENSNGNVVEFLRDASTVGAINVTTTATSYVTSSDYRLKENIAPMTGALEIVQQLKPVTYNWKTDGSSGQGFIAHELQEVVPECVTGEKDAVTDEGNPQYQGIDTSFLVATLTSAIQEQQAIIKELKTRIEMLENK